jgi:hypothetical protein
MAGMRQGLVILKYGAFGLCVLCGKRRGGAADSGCDDARNMAGGVEERRFENGQVIISIGLFNHWIVISNVKGIQNYLGFYPRLDTPNFSHDILSLSKRDINGPNSLKEAAVKLYSIVAYTSQLFHIFHLFKFMATSTILHSDKIFQTKFNSYRIVAQTDQRVCTTRSKTQMKNPCTLPFLERP